MKKDMTVSTAIEINLHKRKIHQFAFSSLIVLLLASCNKYESGLKDYGKQKYAQAYSEFKAVEPDDKNSGSAIDYIGRIKTEALPYYREQIQDFMRKEDYRSAIRSLEEAQKIYGDTSSEILPVRNELETALVLFYNSEVQNILDRDGIKPAQKFVDHIRYPCSSVRFSKCTAALKVADALLREERGKPAEAAEKASRDAEQQKLLEQQQRQQQAQQQQQQATSAASGCNDCMSRFCSHGRNTIAAGMTECVNKGACREIYSAYAVCGMSP